MLGRDELQGEIQDYHGGIFDLGVTDVTFADLDRDVGFEGAQMATAAFDHGGRVVDADDAAIIKRKMTPHHQGGGAERTAEIVQGAAGLGETFGHHANGRKNVGVTGD